MLSYCGHAVSQLFDLADSYKLVWFTVSVSFHVIVIRYSDKSDFREKEYLAHSSRF